METSGYLVILASFTAAAVTAAAIFLAGRYGEWIREKAGYFKSFASGVLITITLLHIVPEAVAKSVHAPGYLAGGYFCMFLLSYTLKAGLRKRKKDERSVGGIIPVAGIAFHSFLDGIIYAVTFNISILTGLLAAVGMIFHEFPEGVVTFALFESIGFSRRKAEFYALFAVSLSTPLGALIALPVVNRIGGGILGILLAFSGGVLLFVGATHLLPEAEKRARLPDLLTVTAGVAVALVFILLS